MGTLEILLPSRDAGWSGTKQGWLQKGTSFTGDKKAGTNRVGCHVKVITLPPKWVQSTDLLGKDNLGGKFWNNKVTYLTEKSVSVF